MPCAKTTTMSFRVFEYFEDQTNYVDTNKEFTVTPTDISRETPPSIRNGVITEGIIIATMLRKVYGFEQYLYGWILNWTHSFMEGSVSGSKGKIWYIKRII